MGGMGGLITSFNIYIYISQGEKIKNEERELLRDFFLEILVYEVFAKKKQKKCATIYYS